MSNPDIFDKHINNSTNTYHEHIINICKFGSLSKIGFNCNDQNHFLSITSSQLLCESWKHENQLKNNSEIGILNSQIEKFQPDVFFTTNPSWVVKNSSKINLKNISLKAVWCASPLAKSANFSIFNLGLSFNSLYKHQLLNAGVSHTDIHTFCFDSQIYNRVVAKKSGNDLIFSGSYNPSMFAKRNSYLDHLYSSLSTNYKLRFYLRTANRRLLGLYPNAPLRLFKVVRNANYLEDYLSTIKSTKINFNCHSDITGIEKGNIRIFETLGMKSFLLTDDGQYPKGLLKGRDFITYIDYKDLIDKAKYFLENELERIEIAEQGFKSLKENYDIKHSSHNLETIFNKYL